MYSYFEGKLQEKTPTYAIIECNGVGYMINISLHTFTKIKDEERCKLYTHLAVKEDAHTLYGFADKEERTLFRHLISVSGVGANTARMMLSSLNPEEIFQAIVTSNVSILQSIKGIGTKTAQRIILDLKDKLGKLGGDKEILFVEHNTKREEALSALILLGFNKSSVEKILDKILRAESPAITVEHLIKSALKSL
ncbi:MAG: Holliday junction branch migration protein RuvA [Bacteroidetes bacterium]|nr:Holliday junction branch migration protein RuvA [Bacteroidota bacterium]